MLSSDFWHFRPIADATPSPLHAIQLTIPDIVGSSLEIIRALSTEK